MKQVHYERVSIDKARKLWINGEKIYCMPIYERNFELVDGIYISVSTSKDKDSNFDEFVNSYKSVSRNNMRYYIETH